MMRYFPRVSISITDAMNPIPVDRHLYPAISMRIYIYQRCHQMVDLPEAWASIADKSYRWIISLSRRGGQLKLVAH